ncbi:3-isopropylmalate dehydratase large subunit [Sesbania bispinosa]|nr:3-isopropylmalate dehydratase large subunit [Sesbania bispinosa]
MTGTSSGSQRKGFRVKSPTWRGQSCGGSAVNESVGQQKEEKKFDARQVKRVLRVKSPTKERLFNPFYQKRRKRTTMKVYTVMIGKMQHQVGCIIWPQDQKLLKSPRKDGVEDSEAQLHLKKSLRAADVGQNEAEVHVTMNSAETEPQVPMGKSPSQSVAQDQVTQIPAEVEAQQTTNNFGKEICT